MVALEKVSYLCAYKCSVFLKKSQQAIDYSAGEATFLLLILVSGESSVFVTAKTIEVIMHLCVFRY